MRITFAIPKLNTLTESRKKTFDKHQAMNTPVCNNNNISAYPIPFLGYATNRKFLDYVCASLQNDVFEADKNNNLLLENDFSANLEHTYENNPELFNKLKSNKHLFKKISHDYDIFHSNVITSLDEVRYQDKIYTPFWKNNAKIGKQKISTLISPKGDTTEILKNCSDKEYADIKNRIFFAWLENEIDEYGKKHSLRYTNELSYKAAEVHKAFDERSIDVIFDKNSSFEEKKSAFDFMNSFIYEKLQSENGKNLENLLRIADIQKRITSKADYESINIVSDEINELYEISKDCFDKLYLDDILKSEKDKLSYISKAEASFKQLKHVPGYVSLNTDEKYYTALYFVSLSKIANDEDYNINTDDFLKLIISDRNIQEPKDIIDTLSSSVSNIQNEHFNNLNEYFNILRLSKDNPEIKFPEFISYNPNYNLSIENHYLGKLAKKDLFLANTAKQRNFLMTLTRDEFNLLNDKLKTDWINKELPYVMFKEVRKQAYKTSIGVNILNELKSVNENLNLIKIKMDDMTYSFDKFLQSPHTIKNSTEELKINNNSTDIISDLKRKYNSMPESDKQEFDKAISAYMPTIIDELKRSVDKEEDKRMLDLLKEKSKQQRQNNSSPFLNTISAILITRTAYNGIGQLGALASASTATGSAASAASAASLGGSSIGSTGAGIIPGVDPVTTVIFTIIACTAAIGIGKAKSIEAGQRPLIYTLDYNT